jgi:hypothetical protein
MRVAKNRTAIEEQIRNGVADLSLNEAAAMLMLTSDMNKLIHFMREAENLSGEELIERCIAEGYTVIQDDMYDMFAGRSDAEILEWHLSAFLSCDADAGRSGMEPKNTCLHVEWILQRPFQNVAEWLGEEGDKFRGRFHNGGSSMSAQFKADWAAFLDQHRGCTHADAEEKLKRLQREFEQTREEGRIQCDASSKRGAGKSKPTNTRRKRCTTN